jgi:hypothetical protein
MGVTRYVGGTVIPACSGERVASCKCAHWCDMQLLVRMMHVAIYEYAS